MNPHPTYYAVDVNDRGTVLFGGYEEFPDSGVTRDRFSFWRRGVLTSLPELNFPGAVRPFGIGANDEVFGELQNDGVQGQRGFIRWADGGVQLFIARDDAGNYLPQAIVALNRHGEFIRERRGGGHVFVSGSTVTDIADAPPFTHAAIRHLNDQGIAVGIAGDGNIGGGSPFAWSLDGGALRHISESCYREGGALRINNKGLILMSCACGGRYRGDPLLYDINDGSVRNLGGLFALDFELKDLNDRGWVVANETFFKRAVLFRSGGQCDVGAMLPPEQEWSVESAWAINNSGLVIAGGRRPDSGYPTALLIQLDVLPDGGIDPAFAE